MINLSGPSKIHYYSNHLGKKIIVLGDIHKSKEGYCKGENIYLIKYLKDLFARVRAPNMEYDIFIESVMPKESKQDILGDYTYYDSQDDIIPTLINYIRKNKTLKNNQNVRYHFSDLRNELDNAFIFNAFAQFGTSSNLSNKLLNPNIYKNDVGFNLYDLFFDMNNIYIGFFIRLLGALKKIISGKVVEPSDDVFYFEKLFTNIKRMKQKDNKILIKLLEILIQKIIIFIDPIIRINDNLILYKNYTIDENFNSNITERLFSFIQSGRKAGAYYTDLNIILEILLNDNYKNCILYLGYAHLESIEEYLKIIGLTKDLEIIANEQDGIRCLKDVFDFYTFFKDGIPYNINLYNQGAGSIGTNNSILARGKYKDKYYKYKQKYLELKKIKDIV